jgi:hypothetical protein
LLPPSVVVPPSEPDVTAVPDAPAAAASPPLEALPLVARPLVGPPEALPLFTTPLVAPLDTLPLVAPPDELPLAEVPLAVAAPVVPPEPEKLTDPDEPDDVPAEPAADALLPEDPEPPVTEGGFEPEHARLIVTPVNNHAERHLADMRPRNPSFGSRRAKARINRRKRQYKYHVLGSAR